MVLARRQEEARPRVVVDAGHAERLHRAGDFAVRHDGGGIDHDRARARGSCRSCRPGGPGRRTSRSGRRPRRAAAADLVVLDEPVPQLAGRPDHRVVEQAVDDVAGRGEAPSRTACSWAADRTAGSGRRLAGTSSGRPVRPSAARATGRRSRSAAVRSPTRSRWSRRRSRGVSRRSRSVRGRGRSVRGRGGAGRGRRRPRRDGRYVVRVTAVGPAPGEHRGESDSECDRSDQRAEAHAAIVATGQRDVVSAAPQVREAQADCARRLRRTYCMMPPLR